MTCFLGPVLRSFQSRCPPSCPSGPPRSEPGPRPAFGCVYPPTQKDAHTLQSSERRRASGPARARVHQQPRPPVTEGRLTKLRRNKALSFSADARGSVPRTPDTPESQSYSAEGREGRPQGTTRGSATESGRGPLLLNPNLKWEEHIGSSAENDSEASGTGWSPRAKEDAARCPRARDHAAAATVLRRPEELHRRSSHSPQERPQLSSLERTAVSGHGDLVTAGEAQLLETLLPAQARSDTAVSAPRPAGPSSNAAGRGL